ncbi:YceI family protein [Emticicia sp. C21]|uniref:YceI family protein n=1 Tax=Emticicia sp. C21 TaxID=2302915 RepID=UPI000E340D85|nr:YceI family protein [Emticicia sp. C21]RFS15539.1 polyisoprenoid-binding protein [Emticicia sp. C21]
MPNNSFRSISLVFLLFASVLTQAQNWKPSTATITFTIKHAFGTTANGSFKGFTGVIVFDPKNLPNASMKASIDTKTIDTGLEIRDKTLRGSNYFDTEKYPKISLTSTRIETGAKENEFIGYFNLTIKKTTKNIQIPFSFIRNNSMAQLKSTFEINRLEYAIGEKSSLLRDIATVSITLNVQQ